MNHESRIVLRRIAGRCLLGTALVASSLTITLTNTSSAWASCGSPNFYALGNDTSGGRWGAAGNITSYNVDIPLNNFDFTDQALHGGLTSGKGLEVGWYEGYGAQTGTYVSYPHVYATADGPREVDGPYIGDETNYYFTDWEGSGLEDFYVNHYNTNVFGGTIGTDGFNGPGPMLAVGEVNFSGGKMKGNFSGLQHLFSNNVLYNWPGISSCADSGYQVTVTSNNSMSDSGS